MGNAGESTSAALSGVEALRRPLGSSMAGAHFDPECAAVFGPNRPTGKAASRRGRHSIENQHENVHWIQLVATPHGELQTTIKQAKLRASIHFLLALDDLEGRMRDRIPANGQCLLDPRALFDARRPRPSRPEMEAQPSLAWSETYGIALRAEMAWNELSKAGLDSRRAFPPFLIEHDPEFAATFERRPDGVESFLQGRAALDHEGLPIDTRDLLEAAAVTLECLMQPLYERRHYDADARIAGLLGTSYMRASALAARAWKVDAADVAAYAAPLLTCVDVALAAPLPPRDGVAGLRWPDLYPPLRFLAAVEAVCASGLDRMTGDVAAWTDPDTRARVARSGGLALAKRRGDVRVPGQDAFGGWLAERDASAIRDDPGTRLGFLDLLTLCQGHAADLQRSEDLGWHMDKVFALAGRRSSYFSRAPEPDRKRMFVYHAPYVVTGRGTYAASRLWPDGLPEALLWTGLGTYALHDVLHRCGEPRYVPSGWEGAADLRDRAKAIFVRTLGTWLGFEPPL